MDITKYINKRTGEENQIERFEKMRPKIKTKQELRNLEMHLLKPKPIPEYKGSKSGMSDFKKRTILFSFPDSKCVQRLGKIININKYIENNTYDVSFLMELVRLIELGRIEWHKKRYYVKARNGGKIRL